MAALDGQVYLPHYLPFFFSVSHRSLATQQRTWISSGFVRLLAEQDPRRPPEMNRMGVPLTMPSAKTEEDRQVMEMIYSQTLSGRPYLVPPGVPADRVAALRAALAAMLADPALLE